MYEHTIGVPLVIAGPGIPAGRRFTAQAYLRDLFPTVCELTGVPIPATVEGRSFTPVLRGLASQVHAETYAYWHRPDHPGELPIQRMVRTDRWKLIYYAHLPRWQLFDLESDPHELKDLSADPAHQAVLRDLQGKLNAWFTPRIRQHRDVAAKAGRP